MASFEARVEWFEKKTSELRDEVRTHKDEKEQAQKELKTYQDKLIGEVGWLRALVSSTFARETMMKEPNGVVHRSWSSPIEETTYKRWPLPHNHNRGY